MKQNNIKLLAVLFAMFFASISHNVNAQKIEKTNEGYVMGNTIYLKNNMVDLFKDSPDALLLYEKAKRQNSVGDVTLGFGVALTIPGVLLISKGRSTANQKSKSPLETVANGIGGGIFSAGGLFFVTAGVGLGAISLISYSASKSNYKKAIREYNWNKVESVGYKKDEVFIETSVTGNGFSLTYNF